MDAPPERSSRLPSGPVVGLLYAGELGAALAQALGATGLRVVTTTAGRSQRTQDRAREAGLEVFGSLAAVKCAADLVISLVPPAAAFAVAEQFGEVAPWSTAALYVDANSVSPETACRISVRLGTAGIDCVDASVAGLASQMAQRGTVYLSGARAEPVADLLSRCVRTRIVGPDVGAASAVKMMIGGLSKGLTALFLELGVAAEKAGVLDDVLDEYNTRYPAVMAVVNRMLPTYAVHGERRAQELGEVARMMESRGLVPAMVRAAEEITVAVGQTTRRGAGEEPVADTVRRMLRELADRPVRTDERERRSRTGAGLTRTRSRAS